MVAVFKYYDKDRRPRLLAPGAAKPQQRHQPTQCLHVRDSGPPRFTSDRWQSTPDRCLMDPRSIPDRPKVGPRLATRRPQSDPKSTKAIGCGDPMSSGGPHGLRRPHHPMSCGDPTGSHDRMGCCDPMGSHDPVVRCDPMGCCELMGSGDPMGPCEVAESAWGQASH